MAEKLLETLEDVKKTYGEKLCKAFIGVVEEELRELPDMKDPPFPFQTEEAKKDMLRMPCNTPAKLLAKINSIENGAARDQFMNICADRLAAHWADWETPPLMSRNPFGANNGSGKYQFRLD